MSQAVAKTLHLGARLELNADAYNSYPALRFSHIKQVLKSPMHYQHTVQASHAPTAAMQRGTNVHAAVLEPAKFKSTYVVAPKFDKRTKEGKAGAAEFEAANVGKIVVSPEEFELIDGCVHSAHQHPAAIKLILGGEFEQSFVWKDAETGLDLKCRPDILRAKERLLVDVKTCQDASDFAFQRSITTFKYHMQAAMYLDGVSAVTGQTFDRFLIIAVESTAPFAVAVYELDEGTLEKGRELYRKALGIIAECTERDFWPGYSNEIQPINLPTWAWSE